MLTKEEKSVIVSLQRSADDSAGHSPLNWSALHSRSIFMVLYPTGAAHGLTIRCAVTRMAQPGGLGHAQMNQMGCPVCTTSFAGGNHINYTVIPEGGFFLKKNNKSLIMQDAPDRSRESPKSHRKKVQARKATFKVIFKLLEALLMIVEVIKGICEIFKR